jgi:hypothetical protein
MITRPRPVALSLALLAIVAVAGSWLSVSFENLSTLPIDEHSMLVRTQFTATRFSARPEYQTSTGLDSMQGLLRAYKNGRIQSYGDLLWRSKPPTAQGP